MILHVLYVDEKSNNKYLHNLKSQSHSHHSPLIDISAFSLISHAIRDPI